MAALGPPAPAPLRLGTPATAAARALPPRGRPLWHGGGAEGPRRCRRRGGAAPPTPAAAALAAAGAAPLAARRRRRAAAGRGRGGVLALRAASPSESFDEPRRPGETDDGEGEDVDLSRLGTLRFAFDVVHQGMNCESSTALELTRELQQWVEENEGVDYKGMKTRHWARRLTRGLGRHRALRQWLWTKGVAHTLEELTRRSEQHTQRYEAISHHHAALRGEVVDLDGNDLQEVTPEEYAQAVAFMVSEWWVCKTRWWIMKMIDEFYLLSPEMLIRGHPRWAFRNGGTPEGWKRYKVPGKGEMWWNPKTKRMQRGAPEQESPAQPHELPPKREPPLALLDIGSCTNPFVEHQFMVEPLALDLQPMHPDVRKADFLQLPVVDAEPGAEGERFTLNEDGSLRSITAGSFDVAVLSLVLSYVPTPLQRLEMIRKARRCLTDERGLLFVVEAGRVVPSREFYEGDPATEWSNAISKCGFKCIRYADQVFEHKKRYDVHQWIFETAPVDPDVEPEPLFVGKEYVAKTLGYKEPWKKLSSQPLTT